VTPSNVIIKISRKAHVLYIYVNGLRNLLCENKIKFNLLLHDIPQLLNKSGIVCTSHYRCHNLQSTELAFFFLNTRPIRKVFYMKVIDFSELYTA
jgi:hypothetical protein